MELRQTLARTFAVTYPGEAAAVLDTRLPEEVAAVLSLLPPDVAAGVLGRMAPASAVRVVERIDAPNASKILVRMTLEAAVSLLRRLGRDYREAVVKELPKEHADAVGAVIGFRAGTAGALMDPRLLAVPSDMTVEEAVESLRRNAEYSHYNLYVIDRDQVLVGVLNIHELFLADSKERLREIMKAPQHRLEADADRRNIISHPGWRHVHSLPVVDGNGRFLGAIRYRTFRRLETEARGVDVTSEGKTAQALGDLFGTGLGGFLDAIASAISVKRGAGPAWGGRPGPRGE